MTNTEAISILENEKNNHINEGKGFYYVTRTEAVDMAINALTAIEDIKAEIAKYNDIELGKLYSRSNVDILQFGSEAYHKGIEYALSVIDKHISGKESE